MRHFRYLRGTSIFKFNDDLMAILRCNVGSLPLVPLLWSQGDLQCHPHIHRWLCLDDRVWKLQLLLQDWQLQLLQVSRVLRIAEFKSKHPHAVTLDDPTWTDLLAMMYYSIHTMRSPKAWWLNSFSCALCLSKVCIQNLHGRSASWNNGSKKAIWA